MRRAVVSYFVTSIITTRKKPIEWLFLIWCEICALQMDELLGSFQTLAELFEGLLDKPVSIEKIIQ